MFLIILSFNVWRKLFQPALFVWEDFFKIIFNGYRLIFLIPLKQVLVNYIFLGTFPFYLSFQNFDTELFISSYVFNPIKSVGRLLYQVPLLLISLAFDLFSERLNFCFAAPLFISALIFIIFVLLFSLCLFWFPFSNFQFWCLAH